ncbi:MAG: PASTA domain-containing protein, partial [Peptostreptococcaceae bacterium]
VISKGSLEVYDASNDEVEEYIAPVEPPKEEVVEPEVEPEPYIPPSINIIGYTLEQAESMLTSNSLKLGNIKYEDNSEFDKGIVFSQTQNNDTYDVIVSNGPKQNSLLGNLFNKDEEEPEVETSTTDDLENESPQFELPQEDIVAPTVPQVEETIPVPEVSESIVPEIEQEEITPEITPDPAPPIVIPEPEEEIVPEELPEEQVVPDVVVPEVNEPEVTPEVQDNVLNEEYVEPENNSEEI